MVFVFSFKKVTIFLSQCNGKKNTLNSLSRNRCYISFMIYTYNIKKWIYFIENISIIIWKLYRNFITTSSELFRGPSLLLLSFRVFCRESGPIFYGENVESFPFASQNDALPNKIVTTSLNFNIEKSHKDENKKEFLRIMAGRFELVLK